jgi:hypothetical protein
MENCRDEQDKLTIKITTCTNVQLFNELGVPELGKFVCDHDVAGFPVIEDEVNCEFRRFCTIAKGAITGSLNSTEKVPPKYGTFKRLN